MPWQPAVIAYPDIELVLTGRYRSTLAARDESYAANVFVSASVPDPREPRMVIIRRDGGTQAEMRDRPRVTLQVFAEDDVVADQLAHLVMALAPSFVDGSPIVHVPTNGRFGPYAVPDESGSPLRQMSVEFHTRGEAL